MQPLSKQSGSRSLLPVIMIGLLALLVVACSGGTASAPQEPEGEVPQAGEGSMMGSDEDMMGGDTAGDEHMEGDEHPADEHNEAGAEHVEGDEHTDDEHMEDDMMGGGGGHMHTEVPEEYAGLSNPFAGDAEAITAGETIFQTNCAVCHGESGQGDGPAAEGLDPAPANLADGMMMRDLSDGYLFWRITEGGAMDPFNSTMPAWGASLSEEERWQVISYIRTLSR